MKKKIRRDEDGNIIRRKKKRPIDEAAGHPRREAKRRATDDLDEELEARSDDTMAIDPKKLVIDREIVQNINSLVISGADNDKYVYAWPRWKTGESGGTNQVDDKLSLSVTERDAEGKKFTYPLWEVVVGDMPESRERKAVDGTRKIGDVLLMRARRERFEAYEAWQDEKRKRQQLGIVSNLVEYGERHRGQIKVHQMTGEGDADSKSIGDRAMRHAAASELANRQLDEQIRRGRVAGAEMGRR